MSKTPPPSSSTPATPAAPAPKLPFYRRKWVRRSFWTLTILIVLATLFRVSLNWIVPKVVSRVAAAYDMDCQYDRMELSLTGGDAGVWGLRIVPRQSGTGTTGAAGAATSGAPVQPIVQAEYCRLLLSPLHLLTGTLYIQRIEADGAELLIERDANGSIPLLDRLAGPAAAAGKNKPSNPATPAPAPAPTNSASNQPPKLDPPLRIDAVRVQNLALRWRDRSVTPQVDTLVRIDARLSDVAVPGRPIRFELDLRALKLLDALRLAGKLEIAAPTLTASLDSELHALKLPPAAGYLASAGLRPVGQEISAQAKLLLTLTVPSTPTDPWKSTVQAEQLSLSCDGQEAAGLDLLRFAVELNPKPHKNKSATAAAPTTQPAVAPFQFSSIVVEGPRGYATRSASGSIVIAGLELGGASSPTTAPASSASSSSKSSATTKPADAPLNFNVHEMIVRRASAVLLDQAVTPATTLGIELDELAFKLPGGLSRGQLALEVKAQGRSPGIAKAFTITGQTQLTITEQSASLQIAAQGIKPDALKPYLDSVGLQSLWNDARFTCNLEAGLIHNPDGSFKTRGQVSNLALYDGDTSLMHLHTLRIDDVAVNPVTRRLRLGQIALWGPWAVLRHHKDDTWTIMGMRLMSGSEVPEKPRAKTAPPATQPMQLIKQDAVDKDEPTTRDAARLEIGQFKWSDIQISLEDQAVTPARQFYMTDAGLELSDLVLDMTLGQAPPPGKFKAWLASPDIVEFLQVEGSLGVNLTSASFSVDTVGYGLKPANLSEYFKQLPVEVVMRDGSLRASATGKAQITALGLITELTARDVNLAEGSQSLLSASSMLAKAHVKLDGSVEVFESSLDGARLSLTRQADGSFWAAGLRYAEAPAPKPAAATKEVAPAPVTPAPAKAATNPANKNAGKPRDPKNNLGVVVLSQLRLQDTGVIWNDLAVQPHVKTAAVVSDLQMQSLVLGRPAPPATLDMTARVDGAIDQARIKGSFSPVPELLTAKLAIDATGIRSGPLASYFPPNVALSLKQGTFAGQLEALWAVHEKGGNRGHLKWQDLRLGEAGQATPQLKLSSAGIVLDRLDPDAGVIALNSVTLEGAELDVQRDAQGRLRIPGLALGPDPSAPKPAAAVNKPAAEEPRVYRAPNEKFPLFTLEKLSVNVQRLGFADAQQAIAVPVQVRDLKLQTVEPIRALGDNANEQPPVKLQVGLSLEKQIERIQLDASLTPFARAPGANLTWTVRGIQGDGLLALVPGVKSFVKGDGLTQGQWSGTAGLSLQLDRRTPVEFDPARGLVAYLSLNEIAYRATSDGPVLLGVEEIRLDQARLEPNFAGVQIGSLEISMPTARATLENDGLHVLGFVVNHPLVQAAIYHEPSPAAESPESESQGDAQDKNAREEKKAEPNAVTENSPEAAPAPTAANPGMPIRLQRLAITGVDVEVADQTVWPATIIPLKELEFEAFDLSNQIGPASKPVRYSLLLGAGNVPIDPPGESEEENAKVRKRELFAQITSSGRMQLGPQPAGWVKFAMHGLELAALRGQAPRAGATLNGGVMDFTLDLRLRGDGSGRVDTRTVMTNLKLHEPAGGKIERSVKLPVALDVAIAALQDADGSITIPLGLSLKQGQITRNEIVGNVILASAGVVATAVASKPLQAVAAVGALAGGNQNKNKSATLPPMELPFAIGSPTLESQALKRLDELAQVLAQDSSIHIVVRHELGKADVERAATRANPSLEDCMSLLVQLRARRTELQRMREDVAGQARGQLGAKLEQTTTQATLNRLGAIQRELAETEDALDLVGDLLSPGADRQGERRTRAAALVLARQRLEGVKQTLLSVGIPDAANRVSLGQPSMATVDGDQPGRIVVTLTSLGKRSMFDAGLWLKLVSLFDAKSSE